MTYRTDYIVVQGNKQVFEDRVNSLSIQGYTWSGNMNTNVIGEVFIYSLLMTKTEPIKQ